MTLSKATLSRMTRSIKTLSIITLSITNFFAKLSINESLHIGLNSYSASMTLSVINSFAILSIIYSQHNDTQHDRLNCYTQKK
jgi:hypothetical protein